MVTLFDNVDMDYLLEHQKKNIKTVKLPKVFVDTSIIVDIAKGKQDVISLCEQLTHMGNVYICPLCISEVLTGAYLRKDYKIAVKKAEKVLDQFRQVLMADGEDELIAEFNAYLIAKVLPVVYQDVVIAVNFVLGNGDVLLTENKERFMHLPKLNDKVMTPKEFYEKNREFLNKQ
jgi:predicted nucleic acid-binding protein